MRLHLAAIVLANAIGAPVHAVPVHMIDWGVHDAVEAAAFPLHGGNEQYIRFVVTAAAPLSVAVLSRPARGAGENKGGEVTLFAQRVDGDGGGYALSSTFGAVPFAAAALVANEVAEPAAIGLVLAGLAALAWSTWRKRAGTRPRSGHPRPRRRHYAGQRSSKQLVL